jgi:hypothetical protein
MMGQDRRDVAAGLRHDRGLHGLDADIPPGAECGAEGCVDPAALFILALEQGDAFPIFAHTSQYVTILGLRLVLALQHRDQAASDH